MEFGKTSCHPTAGLATGFGPRSEKQAPESVRDASERLSGNGSCFPLAMCYMTNAPMCPMHVSHFPGIIRESGVVGSATEQRCTTGEERWMQE